MLPSGPQIETRLREALPLASALFVVFVDLAPRPAGAGGGLAPFLTLGVVYFWTVYRPDLMNAPAVFAVGLVHDLLSGLPPGVTALALLAGRAILVARQGFFHAKSFGVLWVLFLLWAPAVELVRYFAAAASFGRLADPTPLALQGALTIVLYPALSWVLVRLHAQVRMPDHAEP